MTPRTASKKRKKERMAQGNGQDQAQNQTQNQQQQQTPPINSGDAGADMRAAAADMRAATADLRAAKADLEATKKAVADAAPGWGTKAAYAGGGAVIGAGVGVLATWLIMKPAGV